ncbi:hypothetical protein P7L68_10020 [Tistrella mobilis]|uniref:hypothetical protein n=1 Tax=Tistrella mobilis TaxID=171437 RepID=UPI00355823FE
MATGNRRGGRRSGRRVAAVTLPPPAHAAWQRLPPELVPFDPSPPDGGARPVWYLAAEGRESVLVASCRAGGGPVLYWVALAGAARAGGRVPPGVAALEVVWRVGDGPAEAGVWWAGPTPDMLRPEGDLALLERLAGETRFEMQGARLPVQRFDVTGTATVVTDVVTACLPGRTAPPASAAPTD